ncbi:MAG: hypothetical protein JKY01_05695 [Pseudomonadales bacterium]|nr:hypothetical protein [Pseudomonadales bacterium]
MQNLKKKTPFQTSAKPMWQSGLLLLLSTIVCLPFLDIELANTDPWNELSRMGMGLLHVNFSINGLGNALLQTVAFALQAVAISSLLGFIFTFIYHWPGVRHVMTFLRSIHELFWALILLQIFGLSPLTGVLAIAIPYSATFARVFAEILQETPKHSFRQINGNNSSRFIYSTLALAWPRISTYLRYRLECALRASVVLGFIGLPTLGYQLESFLKLGHYSESVALILVFVTLVLSMKWWTKRYILGPLLLASLIYYPPTLFPGTHWQPQLLMQFLGDILPPPFQHAMPENTGILFTADTWHKLWLWFIPLWETQILSGAAYTLILGQLALALSAGLSLLLFPLICKHTNEHRWLRNGSNFFLVVLRCLPEILLAFIGLIFLGPSLLPGVLAIGLHNGALLAHLIGRYSNEFTLRSDCHLGPSVYFYEVLPRVYPQFLTYTLYRGETILRETAILGILGIPTLGFFIDSAFEEFHFDRAILLILASVIINIFAEMAATGLREHLHVKQHQRAYIAED